MTKNKDEQPYIFVGSYGDLLAQINGMELVEFHEDGGYQGEYCAVLKAEAADGYFGEHAPERLYYFFGHYGSCSGCDWLESEGEVVHDDKDGTYKYKVEYKTALEFAQQSKPTYIVPASMPLEFTSEEYEGFWLKEDKK